MATIDVTITRTIKLTSSVEVPDNYQDLLDANKDDFETNFEDMLYMAASKDDCPDETEDLDWSEANE